MHLEELVEAQPLRGIEAITATAQQSQPGPVPAQGRAKLPGYPHQVQSGQPDCMEAVRNDRRVGEPALDHRSVRVGQIDADHPYLFPASEGAKVARQFRLAASGANIKNTAPLQITKGRREALPFVERVLVYAQDGWTIQAHPLLCFSLGKLGVDPRHRCWPEPFSFAQPRGRDPIVVLLINLLPPSFAAAPTRHNPGQGLHERAPTTQFNAPIPPASDD